MKKSKKTTVKQNERNIPVSGEYDAVVVGGGTSGAIAAISAAFEGLSVLVIEANGCLGGLSTAGLVSPVMANRITDHPIGKLNRSDKMRRELALIMDELGDYDDSHKITFNPINLSVGLETLLLRHGGEILFHTTLTDVIMDAERITHAVIYNKGGLSAIAAKVFIDCTGDADLCYMAGVPTFSGNSDGVNQNISLRFEMAGVDIPRYEAFMKKLYESEGGREAFMRKKYEDGYIREQDIYHFQTFPIPGKPNCLAFNCPELGRAVNVIDPVYMSKQQIEGRRAVLKLAKFCKECIDGFENAFITQISPMLGIRDSRRIQAEYMLTGADIHSYRKFRDGIAVSNYPLDAHGEKNYGIGTGTYTDVPEEERYYEIPMRSLIPVGVDNLLCAGRCAGTDFFAQSTTRIQHTCHYMGEAAGIAAKIAIEKGCPIREIDCAAVRGEMAKRGDLLLKKGVEE